MEKKPILEWTQDVKSKNRWYAQHPVAKQKAAPILIIEFITDKHYQQNNWYATLLNLSIVPIETGPTIWEPVKAQIAAEELLGEYVIELVHSLGGLIAEADKA